MRRGYEAAAILAACALLGSRRRRFSGQPPKTEFPQPFKVGDVVKPDANVSGNTSRGVIRNVREGETGTVAGYDALGRVQVKFKIDGLDVLVNARPGMFSSVKAGD